MPRYTFNGKTYNIPDEKVDSFLTKNLSAEPLNINSFSDVETTEQTEKKQEQDWEIMNLKKYNTQKKK